MAVVLLGVLAGAVGIVGASSRLAPDPLQRIKHLVVIYQENHSFDDLWGGWPGVDGLGAGPPAQVAQDGQPLQCLPQNDVNLTSSSPPLPLTKRCSVTLADGRSAPAGWPAPTSPPPSATTRSSTAPTGPRT